MHCLQAQFVIGLPGPNQWVYSINGQPLFKLDLFSLQRPLPLYCSEVQLGCSNQKAVPPKAVVLSCIALHVKVFSIASSCLVVDAIKVSTSLSVYTLLAPPFQGVFLVIPTILHSLMKHVMSVLLASLQILSPVALYSNLNMSHLWSCRYQQTFWC